MCNVCILVSFCVLYCTCIQRVKQLYQDANLGATISNLEFAFTECWLYYPAIQPSINCRLVEWNVHNFYSKKVKNSVIHFIEIICDNLDLRK